MAFVWESYWALQSKDHIGPPQLSSVEVEGAKTVTRSAESIYYYWIGGN